MAAPRPSQRSLYNYLTRQYIPEDNSDLGLSYTTSVAGSNLSQDTDIWSRLRPLLSTMAVSGTVQRVENISFLRNSAKSVKPLQMSYSQPSPDNVTVIANYLRAGTKKLDKSFARIRLETPMQIKSLTAISFPHTENSSHTSI
jgi:hypothetical protein